MRWSLTSCDGECGGAIPFLPLPFSCVQLTLFFAQHSFVVGREFSGKSTLCKNLCDVQQRKGTFWRRFFLHSVSIAASMRTHGVEVFRTQRGYWGHPELQLIFLDFGGHTVYGAGQEFFMAEANAMAVLLSPLEPQYREGCLAFVVLSSLGFFSFAITSPSFFSSPDGSLQKLARPASSEEACQRMRRELIHWLSTLRARRAVRSFLFLLFFLLSC